jgi:hypothetical protein
LPAAGSLSTALSTDSGTSRIDVGVFGCELMSVFAVRLATVVTTVLFFRSDGLQMHRVYAVCEPASPVVNVVKRKTCRYLSGPQIVRKFVRQDSFGFSSNFEGEHPVPTTSVVNFPCPQPASICLVDLPDEQFFSGKTVWGQGSCAFWVTPSTPLGVVRCTPTSGLDLFKTSRDAADLHTLQSNRWGWVQSP